MIRIIPNYYYSLILKIESALFLEDKPHVDHYQKMQMLFVVDSFKKFIILLKWGIQIKIIINMDQIPRCFETEPKSTITTKGSREVLMRKGGNIPQGFYGHIFYYC